MEASCVADQSNWYVARLASGDVNRTLSNIMREGFSHRYPAIKVGPERFQPIIPGYVFVRLFGHDEEFATVSNIQGIDHMLPKGVERPYPVPTKWMRDFEFRLLNGDYDYKVEADTTKLPWFKKNEKLAIVAGPFCDHIGEFACVRKGLVEIKIPFLGHLLNVRVMGHQVRRLS